MTPTAVIMDQEFLENLPWYKEKQLLKDKSKFISGPAPYNAGGPCNIDLVLACIREALDRPEILEAYKSAGPNENIPDEYRNIIHYFNSYLWVKYGNRPDPLKHHIAYMRRIANGNYTGADDPNLRFDLLQHDNITDERRRGTPQ